MHTDLLVSRRLLAGTRACSLNVQPNGRQVMDLRVLRAGLAREPKNEAPLRAYSAGPAPTATAALS